MIVTAAFTEERLYHILAHLRNKNPTAWGELVTLSTLLTYPNCFSNSSAFDSR